MVSYVQVTNCQMNDNEHCSAGQIQPGPYDTQPDNNLPFPEQHVLLSSCY
jgi:hypothetical protein